MLSLDPRTKIYILIISNLLLLFHLNTISSNLFIFSLVVMFFLLGKKSVGIKLLTVYLISFLCSFIESENKLLSILPYLAYSLNLMLPCIYSGILLCTTTTPSKAVAALRKLKLSEKAIVPLCVLLRFFPSLWQEIVHIHKAMKIRGVIGVSGVIKNPSLTFEHYIIPILMSASSSAQDLTVSAICKGIENKAPHTCLEKVKFSIFDAMVMIIFTAIIGIGFI